MTRPRCGHPVESLLDFHVNGTLEDTERVAVEEHLAACAVCSGIVAELMQVASDLSELGDSVLDVPSRRRFPRLGGPGYGAVAALVIFAVVGIYAIRSVDRTPLTESLDLGIGTMRDSGASAKLSLAPKTEFVELTIELPISAGATYTMRLRGPRENELWGPSRIEDWDTFGRVTRRFPATLFAESGFYLVEIEETNPGGTLSKLTYSFSVGEAIRSGREIEGLRRLMEGGQLEKAETGAQTLLACFEERDGPDSLGVAEVLDALVEARDRLGKYNHPEALPLARRAVEIKQALIPDSPELASSLDNLGRVLRRQGNYEGSRVAYGRSLAIREAVLGPDDPAVAISLDGLAVAHALGGELAAALPLTERSLEIREKALDEDDPRIAGTLNDLATITRNLGDFERGAGAYERSLAIYERSGEGYRRNVAQLLSNLAALRADRGELPVARKLLERSLDIREELLGARHPDLAFTLNNLGGVLRDLGDYEGARRLFERALAIREQVDPDHIRVAHVLTNLGNLLAMQGNFDEADARLSRALSIQEEQLGGEHPEVAWTLNALGNLHFWKADYAGALPFYRRGLDSRRALLGPTHPELGWSLHNYGDSLHRVGRTGVGRRYLEQAVDVWRAGLGPRNLTTAVGLKSLAVSLWTEGEPDAALDLAVQSETIVREQFHRVATSLSEREALRYEAILTSGLDVALTILDEGRLEDRGSATERVWDQVIRSRAMVLDELSARPVKAPGADGEIVADARQTLHAARSELSALMVRGPEADDPDAYLALVEEAAAAVDAAERSLAEKNVDFRERLARRRIGLAEVRAALPSGSVLVAFTEYAHQRRPAGDAPQEGRSSGVFVLRAGGDPQFVPLGSASSLDRLIAAWREAAAEVPRDDAAHRHYRVHGEALRRAIWDPLQPHLRGAQRVVVVPEGALHTVSLASLPDSTGRYLVETAPLTHYLTAEREVIRNRALSSGHGLLAVGNPDFDSAPGSSAADDEGAAFFRGATATCEGFRSLRFRSLSGSGSEVDEVRAIWTGHADRSDAGSTVLALQGRRATETGFKQNANGRRIVHIATHGFFVTRECSGGRPEVKDGRDRGDVETLAESPLLFSGLAFAGANRRDEVRDTGRDDGILTAEEIATLDLRGAEWVVLSACATGLGPVQAGEGVLGLRRSFELAGAHTLIMSLWSISDHDTRLWIRDLYEARLGGASTEEAVREASVHRIEERRRAGISDHPFYWGAFVATGDWR